MRKAITLEQLEKLPPGSDLRLIDVRSEQEYEKQHIPGAINIASEKLPSALQQFSPGQILVCICNHGGQRSQAAAEYLYDHQFENAFYLEGGTAGWFGEIRNQK